MSDKLESEMRSGCGPGQSVPKPTPNVRPTEAEYIRRVAKGLQDAADAMANIAALHEHKTMKCRNCGGKLETFESNGALIATCFKCLGLD